MNILSIFMHIHQAPLIFVSAELSCIDFLLEASTEKSLQNTLLKSSLASGTI